MDLPVKRYAGPVKKGVREELRRTSDLVNAIFDTAASLIMVIDREGRIVRFNRASEAITGFTFVELRGSPAGPLFPIPEERARMEALRQQLFEGGTAWQVETALRTRSGELRLISWSYTALRDAAGNVVQVLATGIDMTECRRLERDIIEARAREQRRLGQDLHDDLGQRLTGIAFLARVLQQHLEESAPESVPEAALLVSMLNEAIGSTREMSRGLAPIVTGSRGLMDALESLAQRIASIFRVECLFQCDIPVSIHDPELGHHLYYIAQEAAGNAIRHGAPKRILISLRASEGTGRLSVADDGIGFDPNAVTEPGLGMHTMEHRARLVRGVFAIQSAPGKGTTVTCSFPLPAG